ncbi:unnamed protein product [Vitrella brassicaformis CCMP3155]|uniref:Uncharacterized protein n=2 Tax=Vitrella brassicaformis TaxID=1169539 RepID=A0A0G4GRI0_VITBC|nr:unnamed protein product [Vitrella brassicaformis CCMP3155]|eukprot:CEM33168.1 unnamed protein product [Vitrella brassicaformis CCMP3155]
MAKMIRTSAMGRSLSAFRPVRSSDTTRRLLQLYAEHGRYLNADDTVDFLNVLHRTCPLGTSTGEQWRMLCEDDRAFQRLMDENLPRVVKIMNPKQLSLTFNRLFNMGFEHRAMEMLPTVMRAVPQMPFEAAVGTLSALCSTNQVQAEHLDVLEKAIVRAANTALQPPSPDLIISTLSRLIQHRPESQSVHVLLSVLSRRLSSRRMRQAEEAAVVHALTKCQEWLRHHPLREGEPSEAREMKDDPALEKIVDAVLAETQSARYDTRSLVRFFHHLRRLYGALSAAQLPVFSHLCRMAANHTNQMTQPSPGLLLELHRELSEFDSDSATKALLVIFGRLYERRKDLKLANLLEILNAWHNRPSASCPLVRLVSLCECVRHLGTPLTPVQTIEYIPILDTLDLASSEQEELIRDSINRAVSKHTDLCDRLGKTRADVDKVTRMPIEEEQPEAEKPAAAADQSTAKMDPEAAANEGSGSQPADEKSPEPEERDKARRRMRERQREVHNLEHEVVVSTGRLAALFCRLAGRKPPTGNEALDEIVKAFVEQSKDTLTIHKLTEILKALERRGQYDASLMPLARECATVLQSRLQGESLRQSLGLLERLHGQGALTRPIRQQILLRTLTDWSWVQQAELDLASEALPKGRTDWAKIEDVPLSAFFDGQGLHGSPRRVMRLWLTVLDEASHFPQTALEPNAPADTNTATPRPLGCAVDKVGVSLQVLDINQLSSLCVSAARLLGSDPSSTETSIRAGQREALLRRAALRLHILKDQLTIPSIGAILWSFAALDYLPLDVLLMLGQRFEDLSAAQPSASSWLAFEGATLPRLRAGWLAAQHLVSPTGASALRASFLSIRHFEQFFDDPSRQSETLFFPRQHTGGAARLAVIEDALRQCLLPHTRDYKVPSTPFRADIASAEHGMLFFLAGDTPMAPLEKGDTSGAMGTPSRLLLMDEGLDKPPDKGARPDDWVIDMNSAGGVALRQRLLEAMGWRPIDVNAQFMSSLSHDSRKLASHLYETINKDSSCWGEEATVTPQPHVHDDPTTAPRRVAASAWGITLPNAQRDGVNVYEEGVDGDEYGKMHVNG